MKAHMTMEVLESGSTQKRNRNETLEAFLSRVTHIALHNKGIEKMENLSICRHLSVLYLYDNRITEISGLEGCVNLERLYLQNNCITRIDNLSFGLPKLKVLHLSHNQIRVLEHLANLPMLEALHVDHQRSDGPFEIDDDCMAELGKTLKTLTLSSNRITSIRSLVHCQELMELVLANNQIQDWPELESVLCSCSALIKLDITQNPICHMIKFRPKVILAATNLVTLNDKDIPDIERQFLQSMEMAQLHRRARLGSGPTSDMLQGLTSQMEMMGTSVAEFEEQLSNDSYGHRPIPHLPPYASQYRDLMLHQLNTISKLQSLEITNSLGKPGTRTRPSPPFSRTLSQSSINSHKLSEPPGLVSAAPYQTAAIPYQAATLNNWKKPSFLDAGEKVPMSLKAARAAERASQRVATFASSMESREREVGLSGSSPAKP